MKKIFIIILLLLIITGVIAPKFIGSVVETEHQSGVNKLNENPAITINSTTFTRQWFTGQATTEVTIVLQDEGIEDITLIVEEDLSFGPVIFKDGGLVFGLSYSQANINFKKLFIDEEIETFINDKIHLSALLTFSKNIVSKVVIDEVSKEVDGNTVTSAKAVGKFTIEDSRRLYGDFNWDGLAAKTNEENFTLGKMKFSLDQTLIAGNYYQGNAISTGEFHFSMDSVVAKDNIDNTAFALNNLLVKAVSDLDDDLIGITMNYSADEIETSGQKLEDVNLDIVINRLNFIVMQEINTFMASLPIDDEAMFTPDKMEELSLLVQKLLVDGPAIEVKDFSVKTAEGKIESSMQVSVDDKLFDTTDIMSIVPAIKVDAKGKAPMSFFTKLGMAPMVEMYVDQGYVILNENELSVKINFVQGTLEINDKVIPM
jgi:hypothetical protein